MNTSPELEYTVILPAVLVSIVPFIANNQNVYLFSSSPVVLSVPMW